MMMSLRVSSHPQRYAPVMELRTHQCTSVCHVSCREAFFADVDVLPPIAARSKPADPALIDAVRAFLRAPLRPSEVLDIFPDSLALPSCAALPVVPFDQSVATKPVVP